MKKIIIFLFVCLFIFLVVFGTTKIINIIDNDQKAWKVEIINDYINVRNNHSVYDTKIDKVEKGHKYKVIDIYLEDDNYIWYKIKLDGGKEGWIASDRSEPYVKEINNPNISTDKEEIDYNKPILKFYTESYETESIDTITFSHLEIIEDSEYEITYEIYKEEDPVDVPGPQYWIKYIVIDAFNNRTAKVQRIIFEENPSDDKVLDFADLNYN